MSGYFHTLQDEEYRPSSRSTSRHRQRDSYLANNNDDDDEDDDGSSSSSHDAIMLMDGSSSDRYHDEPEPSRDKTKKNNNNNHTSSKYNDKQALARSRSGSNNAAHHTRTSIAASRSSSRNGRATTAAAASGTSDNPKRGGKKKPVNDKNSTRNSTEEKGGRMTTREEAKTPAVVRVGEQSSERSSIYSGRSDQEQEEEEDDSFRSSGLSYGGGQSNSRHSKSKSNNRKQQKGSIYDAYKKLSSIPQEERSSILQQQQHQHEEEHSSNNTFSQQTPATSASTQPSTEDDDHSHLHSPSSSHQLQQQQQQQPTGPRRRSQRDKQSLSTTSSHNNRASASDAGYQRKNSKSRNGKLQEANTIISNDGSGSNAIDRRYSNSSIPKQLHVADERSESRSSRTGSKTPRPSQQPLKQRQSINATNPAAQHFMDQMPPLPVPVLYPRQTVQARSIIKNELDPSPSPPSTSLTLKNNLQNGSVPVDYSVRMLSVQDSLQNSINTAGTKAQQVRMRSASVHSSSSSSSGSSRGFGVMEFLGVKKEGKPMDKKELSEAERNRRGNPFLNRPKSVKRFSQIGLHEVDDSSRSHTGSSGDDFNKDGSHHHHKPSLQEQYCPLPWPIKMVHVFCGKIVTNQEFQVFMIVLIMLNALILGIATTTFENPNIPEALDIMDRMLLVVFTIELALQFGYCGYTILLDGWLVFDTLTVVTSWWLEGVQVFRSFRIFRSFRLIVRLPLLKNLVLTVFHVMPRIYSILGLMLLILYIFGVLSTILFGDLYAQQLTDQDYFGRLDYSLFTLFQFITLEGWGDVVRQVAAVRPWSASLIFSSFIVVTGFIMYNLIVAVMCDSMLVVEAHAREDARELKQQKLMLEVMAKEEEEKQLEREMVRQRKSAKIAKARIKGIVDDDPTVADSIEDTTSLDDSEDDEGSVVEMRDHLCRNCGACSEIPKIPASVRQRLRRRDDVMEDNQERVRGLKQKVDQLVGTQQRVTAVLQTLMFEIEAQRKVAAASSTSISTRPEYTERSMESDRFE